jgi:c-di-AMP phosphodiesterase-like protein
MKKYLFCKVFNNNNLIDYIYQFDNTYKKKFIENIISNISLKEHASDFWYNKYMNLLNNNDSDMKLLLHAQDQFLEIFFTLNNNDFTPNKHRFDNAPESNYNMANYY